ncbi:MAG: type II toxin-antitoxin system RelE/ParE family toxin [Thermodesulfobacteriota bacterium]|nr:type II toxin-antitoxin system RelE/ParE family toxin [Thermodesulfobacteriota bacterium]
MRVRFHNRAVKFLERLDEKEKERIRLKLKSLVGVIESQGIIPFKELDVKRLEGEWKGFLRMRIGRIRVICRIEKQDDVLLVYEIDYRGDVYK